MALSKGYYQDIIFNIIIINITSYFADKQQGKILDFITSTLKI